MFNQFLNQTKIVKSIKNISNEDLNSEHPFFAFEFTISKAFLLTQLTTQVAYHLGQINYHRRLLDGKTNRDK